MIQLRYIFVIITTTTTNRSSASACGRGQVQCVGQAEDADHITTASFNVVSYVPQPASCTLLLLQTDHLSVNTFCSQSVNQSSSHNISHNRNDLIQFNSFNSINHLIDLFPPFFFLFCFFDITPTMVLNLV